MKHVAYALAVFYLVWKAIFWCFWDATAACLGNRIPVPALNPEELAALLKAAAPKDKPNQPTPYTGDWLFGALDSYLSPKRFAYVLTSANPAMLVQGYRIDCDDVAILAHEALRQHPDVEWSKVVTLVHAWVIKSHVICVGKLKDGRGFTLDTNGLIYHDRVDDEYLRAYFGFAYSTNYVTAVETDAWFLL